MQVISVLWARFTAFPLSGPFTDTWSQQLIFIALSLSLLEHINYWVYKEGSGKQILLLHRDANSHSPTAIGTSPKAHAGHSVLLTYSKRGVFLPLSLSLGWFLGFQFLRQVYFRALQEKLFAESSFLTPLTLTAQDLSHVLQTSHPKLSFLLSIHCPRSSPAALCALHHLWRLEWQEDGLLSTCHFNFYFFPPRRNCVYNLKSQFLPRRHTFNLLTEHWRRKFWSFFPLWMTCQFVRKNGIIDTCFHIYFRWATEKCSFRCSSARDGFSNVEAILSGRSCCHNKQFTKIETIPWESEHQSGKSASWQIFVKYFEDVKNDTAAGEIFVPFFCTVTMPSLRVFFSV